MHDVLQLFKSLSALGAGLDLERHDIHHLLAMISVRSIPPMMCLHHWAVRGMRPSHGYPMLVSWAILEGTWGMGLGRMLDRQPWVSHVDGRTYVGTC